MLGMVFTEFLEMIEERFSPALADRLIEASGSANGGAYTAVGHYPHEEIVRMVLALSAETGAPVPDLLSAFGEHLFARLAHAYPSLLEAHPHLFDLLAGLDGCIHPEVLKLYPNAQLPHFEVLARDADHLLLRYDSPRRMEGLAAGLIRGAAVHFGEPVSVTLQTLASPGGEEVRILVSRDGVPHAG